MSRFAFLAVVVVTLSSCSQRPDSTVSAGAGTAASTGKPEHQVGRSAGVERGTDKPYFQMDAEERRSFVAKLQRVKLGDSRRSAESLLGKPWDDEVGASKKEGAFLGRFVRYYFTKYSEELVNDKLDESVTLKFDASDRLVKIISQAADIPDRP